MNSGLVREFEKLLGPSSVLYRPEDLLLYRYDGSVEKGRPELVVFPHSTEDVLCIAKLAAKYNVPIVGRGVGTGLSGGALARTGGVMPQRASPKPPPKFSILFLPPAATPRFCSPRQHSSALFASRTVMRTGHQRWVLLALRPTPHAPPQIRLRPAKHLRPRPFFAFPALRAIAGRNPCPTVINKKRLRLERLFLAKLSLNISFRPQGR
jgi:hypothetical protein